MKKLIILLVSICIANFAWADNSFKDEKTKVVNVNDVFIPSGFDSGSDAFVVVSGFFSNGCYRWKDAELTNKTPFIHDIKVMAIVRQGLCTMAIQPYTREIRLGRLDSGEHTLRFENGDGTYFEEKFNIE